MKKILLLALTAIAYFGSHAQTHKEPYLVQSLSGKDIKQVKASTSGGYINVEGVDDGQARLEVFITANNNRDISKEEIQKRLDEMYELKVNTDGGKLEVTARPKERIRDWKKALSISFVVYAPKKVSSDLTTSGGSIKIANLEGGRQDFTTSGGSLDVDAVSGTVKGRTSGGGIEVKGSSGTLDLVTSGGSIKAKSCEGNIELTTSGGSITLGKLKGNVEVATSGGSIHADEINGDLKAATSGGSIDMKNLSCSLDAATSGGHIDVAFNELGKFVKLHNSAGGIDIDVPKGKGVNLDLSGNRVKTDGLVNFDGKVENDDVNGKVNGGGTLIYARSSSGRVSVNFK